MRHLAITGIVTVSMICKISSGSLMRAPPRWARISAGTRSSAITAHAPASSAMRACSGVTTSMITPPLSIWARPFLTVKEPTCPSIWKNLLQCSRLIVMAPDSFLANGCFFVLHPSFYHNGKQLRDDKCWLVRTLIRRSESPLTKQNFHCTIITITQLYNYTMRHFGDDDWDQKIYSSS